MTTRKSTVAHRLPRTSTAMGGLLCLLLVAPHFRAVAQQLTLPMEPNSLRFAVIGDSGTGGKAQREVAEQMQKYRLQFPFEFVLMMGDNIYGRDTARAYLTKFERPYQKLLDAGVKFYATLGNHDNSNQRFYKLFNMGGERFYAFTRGDVRFFSLDSTRMDPQQIKWIENELKNSSQSWKICFLHHPLYSSGKRHGSEADMQSKLEPLFVKYGVSVVFSGHDHFYERIVPQKGVYYFVSGGAAKVRRNNITKTKLTAKGFDQDNHFMLIEIAGQRLHFQTIARDGHTVDSGVIPQRSSQGSSQLGLLGTSFPSRPDDRFKREGSGEGQPLGEPPRPPGLAPCGSAGASPSP